MASLFRPALDLMAQYAAYHRDRRNIATHFIGIPLIVFAISTLLARAEFTLADLPMNAAIVAWALSALWYLTRGNLALGVAPTVNNGQLTALAMIASQGTTSGWLVIGVGVNIAHAPDDVSQPVTSLEAEGCTDLTPGRLLEAFCACFTEHYKQWLDDGFASQREAWLLRAEGRGGPVTVNLEGVSFAGRFVDLDETGALIVDTMNSGRRVVTAGEVFIL